MKHTIILFLLLLSSVARTQTLQFKHLATTEGLSQLSVLAICQDRMGRMWFGTEEGINLFDGHEVMPVKSFGDIIAENGTTVRSIAADARGDIWFMLSEKLVRYDMNKQRYIEKVSDAVSCFGIGKHEVLFTRNNQLCVLDIATDSVRALAPLSGKGRFNDLVPHGADEVWMASSHGVFLYNRATDNWQHWLEGIMTDHLYLDRKGQVWVSTRNQGLYVIAERGERVMHYAAPILSSDRVRGVAEDSEGTVWIGTYSGLDRYDPVTGVINPCRHLGQQTGLSHPSIHAVVCDREGTIWIGTYYGGVNYFNPTRDLFSLYVADGQDSFSLSDNMVGHLTRDREGDLWICTERGGLNRLNPSTGQVTHYQHRESDPHSIADNTLKAIVYDSLQHRLYLGTWTQGIVSYDVARGTFDNRMQRHPEAIRRAGRMVLDMAQWNRRLIFASEQGVWQLNLDHPEAPVQPLFDVPMNGVCSALYIDSRQCIWMVMRTRVRRVSLTDPTQYKEFVVGEKGLGRSLISDVCEDSSGRIYLATRGSGIYRYDEAGDRFEPFTTAQGLLSDCCYELEQAGDLLLANSDQGCVVIDTRGDRLHNIPFSKEFQLNGIHNGQGMLVAGDRLYIAGTNGLASCDLHRLMARVEEEEPCQLYLSRLLVAGREVTPGDETGILQQAPYDTHHIDLAYHQNHLTIHFASDHLSTRLQSDRYEYRLQGYDNHWTRTGQPIISYTKVTPGRYVLEIRQLYDSRVRTPGTMRIGLTVYSPFWQTWWAYLIYVTLVVAIVTGFYRIKRKQLLLQTSLTLERQEKQNIVALNQAKLRFFTSISHEFRTPLTLIVAKLDMLTDEVARGSKLFRQLSGIHTQVDKLMELINELLDFRKLEQGYVELHVERCDLVELARRVSAPFAQLAETRGIRFSFSPQKGTEECWVDVRQMEKVITNLLSNAFKYVPAQGAEISLTVSGTEQEVQLSVQDNGVGIDAKDLAFIFDRFYQAGGDLGSLAASPGTGIGLSLVKQLVEMHRGRVEVTSSVGQGSTFTVCLRRGSAHFSEEQLQAAARKPDTTCCLAEEPIPIDGQLLPPPSEEQEEEEQAPLQDYKVLLVEDNAELLDTLRTLFADTYQVLTATNGQEGLELVRSEHPDLVVSDIMMPVMNGTDLCRTVKNDFAICHIPVILLTAMGTAEWEVNGLKCGADAYITKPFDPKVLLVHCNMMIRQRLRLRRKFARQDESAPDSALLATTALDRDFLQRCESLMDEHLAGEELTVEWLAAQLALSRTSFFNKFKSLTGMTPADYMLTRRLRKAAEGLLKEPEKSINDIAYECGFATPRYFSQAFKKKYGVSPTAYRQPKE